jgi:hypothetical protein
MVKFTAPDDSKVDVDPLRVIRIRAAIYGENAAAKTRIDWITLSLVKEAVDDVVPLIKAGLPSLAVLSGSDGRKIWFDAKQAVGPIEITPTQKKYGFNSSIKIMGYRQYVRETPDEVRSVLRAAGGSPS